MAGDYVCNCSDCTSRRVRRSSRTDLHSSLMSTSELIDEYEVAKAWVELMRAELKKRARCD